MLPNHFIRQYSETTYFFPEKGDNMHEMSKPVFWEKNKKNVINLTPAELAQIELMVKVAVICGLLNQMHHNLFITLLLRSIA